MTDKELGLNVDMTDVDRLRRLSTSTHVQPATTRLYLWELANNLEKEIRDVGELRRLLKLNGEV